jgi:multicomponent K+:H+ antiporter subunit G
MNFLLELLISLLIVIGAIFVLVGSLGLIKLPDLMTRLHAPTKATTLGVGGALIASMLYFLGVEGTLSIHEVLITVFLFLTAPVTAHFIAKAYLHQHPERKGELPPTGGQHGWSTFEAAPQSDAARADRATRGPHD